MIDRLTVQQAALRLGIQSDAVRRRLQRGKLDGEKIDGEWVAFMDAVTTIEPPPAAVTAEPVTAPNTEIIQALNDHITTLKAQNKALVDQLTGLTQIATTQSQTIADQRRFLLAAHEEPDTLNITPEPSRNSTEQTTEQPRRSFWARLRRR